MMRKPKTEHLARVRAEIAEGRGALAAGQGGERENEAVDRLLAHLWHEDREARMWAAYALAGGDRSDSYTPCYGHFAGSLLRGLRQTGEEMPPTFALRYGAVAQTVRGMLAQNADEIHGMSSMNYSFLSSALYLALFSTCRDGMASARRLRIAGAQAEICRLVVLLYSRKTSGRLNPQDVEGLAHLAGRALAAFPPRAIPEFWNALTHRQKSHRQAVLPALYYLYDRRAASLLTDVLPTAPADVAEPLIGCLSRLADPDSLPALADFAQTAGRGLRKQAQAAMLEIERAARISPARTLVRPVQERGEKHAHSLLRALPQPEPETPPKELLRPAEHPPEEN